MVLGRSAPAELQATSACRRASTSRPLWPGGRRQDGRGGRARAGRARSDQSHPLLHASKPTARGALSEGSEADELPDVAPSPPDVAPSTPDIALLGSVTSLETIRSIAAQVVAERRAAVCSLSCARTRSRRSRLSSTAVRSNESSAADAFASDLLSALKAHAVTRAADLTRTYDRLGKQLSRLPSSPEEPSTSASSSRRAPSSSS